MLLQKFQRWMMGRYGTDKLNIFLLAAGLAFSLLGTLLFRPLVLIADVLYLYALFRMFSKNIPARQREYGFFLKYWNRAAGWFRVEKQRVADRKVYKYFKCPHCKQQLRAPRGRGTIEVTCQKCHQVFRTKT